MSRRSAAWIDVSMPIRSGMLRWPNDPAVEVRSVKALRRGDSCALSVLTLGSHTGTHVDAPSHFLEGAPSVDQMPCAAMLGPARVIAIRDPEVIGVEELRAARIRRGERVLFRTANSSRDWASQPFAPGFVYVATEAAQWLARIGVHTVGVDYLSVGGYKKNGTPVHRALLGAGIWIIEGLQLSSVRPGRYDLICLPLRLEGGDGSPARVLLRRTTSISP